MINEESLEKRKENLLKVVEGIIEDLEVYDINSSVLKSIENAINWFIAIGTGLFLIVFSNIDKLLINCRIPGKIFLIFSLIITALGLFVLGIIKVSLFLRDTLICNAKGVLNKVKHKILNDTATEEDLEKFGRQIEVYSDAINKPDISKGPINFGIRLIIIGISIFVIYYIVFVIVYF